MFTYGVFASGGGSNFRALLSHSEDGSLGGICKFLIVNNANCGAAKTAHDYGIPVFHISAKTHPDTIEYERAILEVCNQNCVDFIALAGYMKRVPDCIIKAFQNRMLNVHPSLLPKFGGKGFWGIHVHEAVIAAHETESGPTIHLVSGDFDTGKILAQAKVPVLPTDDAQTLASRVLAKEHELYWQTLRDFAKSFNK